MEVTFSYAHDLLAILEAIDATDRPFHELAIVHATDQLTARSVLRVRRALHLSEFVVRVDDLQYGFVMEPRVRGFDVRAYWRSPPTAGFDRTTAINLALERRALP